MKIATLFNHLENHTVETESIFEESGVTNRSKEMQFGFFPLGYGLLTKEVKTIDDDIAENGVMVLGNDFGTVTYVREKSQGSRGEETGTTIVNLTGNKYGLDRKDVFFTNFYLGLRLDEGRYKGTTNVKRVADGKINKLRGEYKELCYKFFIKQLELTKPRVVVCLGHEVKNALFDNCMEAFPKWTKSTSIKSLIDTGDYKYEVKGGSLGERTFMVINHPCYNSNYKKEHIDCVIEEIDKAINQ